MRDYEMTMIRWCCCGGDDDDNDGKHKKEFLFIKSSLFSHCLSSALKASQAVAVTMHWSLIPGID